MGTATAKSRSYSTTGLAQLTGLPPWKLRRLLDIWEATGGYLVRAGQYRAVLDEDLPALLDWLRARGEIPAATGEELARG